MQHNLPDRPYRKFFGREEDLELIKVKLLNRIGHIASIDGVGGIGKTALTYHFCETVLLNQNQFDFLVWVSAKDTYLDPFDKFQMIKRKENKFKVNPVETLIDETIKLVGFSDMFMSLTFEEKRNFFEEEILKNEKIFFVIDNLENIQGDDFFQYIDSFANFNNTKLKILTTSRKRDKTLTDNAILINEMQEKDAVDMLRYLAEGDDHKKPVKVILNDETGVQNKILVNKVNRVPVLIELIVGQLSLGKSVGQIMSILEGTSGKGMSEVISFMFQNTYEELSLNHQSIFKSILAFQRFKKKDVPFTFLVSHSGISANNVREIIEDLIQNQLVNKIKNKDEYYAKQMAINFGRQFYADFAEFEENIVEIIDNDFPLDATVGVLKAVDQLIEKADYLGAQNKISNVIGDTPYCDDFRLYHKLANIQTALGESESAELNYRKALDLTNSEDKNIWLDWFQMEKKRGRGRFVMTIAKDALAKTNNEITIVIELLGMYRYFKKFDDFRNTVKLNLEYYSKVGDKDSSLILLRHWKKTESDLLKESHDPAYYLLSSEELAKKESKEGLLSLRNEQLKVVKKYLGGTKSEKYKEIQKKIGRVERDMFHSIDTYIRNMKRFQNFGEKEKSKKEAYKILSILGKKADDKSKDNKIVTLRFLFQILITEKEYEKISKLYKDHKSVVENDKNIVEIYGKANRLSRYSVLKQECKSDIGNDRIPFVFQSLKEFCSEFNIEDKLNDIISLERRFISISSAENFSLQGFDVISEEKNRIVKSLLDIIDKLPNRNKLDESV